MASDVEKARDQLRWSLENGVLVRIAPSILVDIEDFIDAKIAEEREKSSKIKPKGGDTPSTSERRDPATYSPAAGESATSSGDTKQRPCETCLYFLSGAIGRCPLCPRDDPKEAVADARQLLENRTSYGAGYRAGLLRAAEIADNHDPQTRDPGDTCEEIAAAIRDVADAEEKEGGRG